MALFFNAAGKRRIENGLEIHNEDAEVVEVMLYEAIDPWWFDTKSFVKSIKNITAPQINLRINSPGGDVFDGYAVYNALKLHSAKVNVFVDGMAASIASVIAMAGDHIVMEEGAVMMIHEPWSWGVGNADDMEAVAKELRQITGDLVGTYRRKTGLEKSEISDMLAEETWMHAEQAVELGFADEAAVDAEAHVNALKKAFDLSEFKLANVPDGVMKNYGRDLTLSIRDAEKALHDNAGFSLVAAKYGARQIIKSLQQPLAPGSDGKNSDLREVGAEDSDLREVGAEDIAGAMKAVAQIRKTIEVIENA